MIESHIEQLVVETLPQPEHRFEYCSPYDMDPDRSTQFRSSYSDVVIVSHLTEALQRNNPTIPGGVLQQAAQELLRIPRYGELITCNQAFHKMLTEGVEIETMIKGEQRTVRVKVLHDDPSEDLWVVTHQVTYVEAGQRKRPDVILYLNGLPVGVMELKNATNENTTIDLAYTQLQNYHKSIPSLFAYNCFEVISDGFEAKVGTITSDLSRFMSWKTADGNTVAPGRVNELSLLMDGMLHKTVLQELITNFTVFERARVEDALTKTVRVTVYKKLAAYHQYYAVKKAVHSTVLASGENGNRKGGVVWHTQGSGKSLSMVFYTGLLVKALNNPTVIVITDRNDLDDQLFDTFANSAQLLRQTPIQIESREALVTELRNRQSGGIFFTTIQKFFPENRTDVFPQLSDRQNIVVIADEAHRTQYGLEAKVTSVKDEGGAVVGQEITYGFARHMRDALPHATFIGFTGTPVESGDKNTKAVFGEYVDIYDIERAVRDGATVPIYYENRFVKLKLEKYIVDQLEDRITILAASMPDHITQRAFEKATRQAAIVGHPDRLAVIALDIVSHFEKRSETLTGKAIVVAMSRSVAVLLYNQIIAIRPEWHHTDDNQGNIKVIMTGSSSDEAWMQPHIRSKDGRTLISNRLKDEHDPLRLVIVVDMWLTGFDAPVLHTLYLDKHMSGHNLMQAIARVNRVFKDKPGGLVVDYVPVTGELKEALKTYTDSGGEGDPTLDIAEAVAAMLTKYEVVQQMYHGFNYLEYFHATVNRKLNIILEAEEHILCLEEGKERYLKEVSALSKSYSLCKVEPEAVEITEHVAFFQAVRARLAKFDMQVTGQQRRDFDETVKSLVQSAVASDGLVNLLDLAGLERPEVSIFSEEFLHEVRSMKQRNVAIEMLKKILNDQIRVRFKRNAVVHRTLTERLQDAIQRYNNKSVTALEMIELLLEITRDVEDETNKGTDLGLTPAEKAFYDALSVNKSAQELMGDKLLMEIAKELVKRVRRSTSIDWTIRQSAKDRVKLEVKRVLRFHSYPPDDETRATETVLEQAELHARELVERS